MQKTDFKHTYEAPVIEVTDFSIEDSIAVSGLTSGVALWEEE